MSRIKNLYTYLISNRRAEVEGWHQAYLHLTGEVAKVRAALLNGGSLQDESTYAETAFSDEEDPWHAFAAKLLYEIRNGIASSGQSVVNKHNRLNYIEEKDFVDALAELIKDPTKESFVNFSAAWDLVSQKHGANRNPLLLNRTLAACTTEVSSTVNGGDFESVYWWLVREGILVERTDPESDWYDKNVHLMRFLRTEFKNELEAGETSEQLLSIFVWNLFENITNPFTLKRQLIKYGAPGTGKTFTAQRDTRLLFEIWREQYGSGTPYTHESNCEVVQFHPSFGYEDFMEGLRPVLDEDGKAQLTLQNGIFKRFCRRAAVWESDVFSIPGCGPDIARRWESLTIADLKAQKNHLPGKHWEFLFGNPDQDKKIAEAVPPFFFIIDEINRAELSRVLGELMLCLEYRGTKGAISTQHASLNDVETGMVSIGGAYKFFVPHNIFLIGTMNTIDRSVESFDLALRRRFRWQRINPDITALRYHLSQRDTQPGNASRPWVGLADDLESLNTRIKETDILGEDYEIGHAYCMNLRYPQTLTRTELREKLWEDAIRPLLEEYLRGSGRTETLLPEFQSSFGVT